MSDYTGKSTYARIRILPTSKHWKAYAGQECDAILYEGNVMPQINSEQLNPPLPKWQSLPLNDLEIIG